MPNCSADFRLSKIAKNGAGVVDSVGQGHQKCVLVHQAEVLNVPSLAGPPVLLC